MNINDKQLLMMKEEKVYKVLLKLGMPTMIGMMVSALYSVVDAYFVGGLGTSQMGAVSIVFPIVQIIIGLGMMFGSGAASYISRLLGKGKDMQANQTASTSLCASLAVGAASIIIALCFLDRLLLFLGATSTILTYARQYAVIYISGSILNIFNVTMNNIITAEGRAKLTMVSMLIGGGLNVILDPLFIYPLGFGIQGAAIATVVAQAATTCLYLWYILGRKGHLKFSARNFVFSSKIFSQILKIGMPILVFQLLASAAIGMTNTAASVYGDSAVAAVGVVIRIMTLGTYVVFGYMKGLQPVAGYNYGAGNISRLQKATRLSLLWSGVFCTAAAVVLSVFPEQIISLFSTADSVMIDIGARALRANALVFPFYGFQMVYMALFLALGKGKEGSLLSISRQGIFFIPAILILPGLLGINGVIWAQPIADVFTVILTAVFAVSLSRKLKGKTMRNADSVKNSGAVVEAIK